MNPSELQNRLQSWSDHIAAQMWDWPQVFRGIDNTIDGEDSMIAREADLPEEARESAWEYARWVRGVYSQAAQAVESAGAKAQRSDTKGVVDALEWAHAQESALGDATEVNRLVSELKEYVAARVSDDEQGGRGAWELDLEQVVTLLIEGVAEDGDFVLRLRDEANYDA